MFASVYSSVLNGLAVQSVKVETDVSDGLPGLNLIGYLSGEVREAGSRVRAALHNSGVAMPAKRIVVNLAPADIPKRGALLDLPIALSILAAMDRVPSDMLRSVLVIGELSLLGTIEPVNGVLLMVQKARENGLGTVILPKQNYSEACLVPGMKIIGVDDIEEVMKYLCYGEIPDMASDKKEIKKGDPSVSDFSDIYGQEYVKRAALISACGYHNLFLLGPPGSGKTMIASRLPYIMPPMSYDECIELSGIYSAAGLLSPEEPLINRRPFRAPHHTITSSALVGGGSIPKPGEITLADHGIIFLDEFTEFKRDVLELLREPLEEHRIRISRYNGNYTFPADFLLVAAANPCPCGYYPDLSRCHCREGDIKKYIGKLSGPLLDRIDMCVRVESVDFDVLSGKTKTGKTNDGTDRVYNSQNKKNDHECGTNGQFVYTTKNMNDMVERVWMIEQERFSECSYKYNGRIPAGEIEKWCVLDESQKLIMKAAYEKLRLSARAYHRILRVARTIADIENSEKISTDHLMEALSYRIDIG